MWGDLSFISWVALSLSLYQFVLFFDSIGSIIPVRYLLGSFMCLQFFVGPAFAYNGAEQYAYFMYKMKIPQEEYFLYVMPAVLSFIVGLHIGAGKLKGERINKIAINTFLTAYPKIPYILIIIGFVSSLISPFIPSEIGFLFYLLGNLKFVGLFMIILNDSSTKGIYLVLIIGSIVSSSLGEGSFHDLLTWIIFTIAVFGLKYKFSTHMKLIGALIFVAGVTVLQSLKASYREAIEVTGGGLETLVSVYEEENEHESLFSLKRIAANNTRINQGFIITNIMKTVPDIVPYSNGEEMWQVIEAAILPRILAPNKLKAGDNDLFTRYSGIHLRSTTSMSLSSVGDAYLNFGPWGGCVFMFLLGGLYNFILQFFEKKSHVYPVLILFTTMIFYYPIRPDTALQTILGHVFKSLVVIYGLVMLWKYQWDKKRTIQEKS